MDKQRRLENLRHSAAHLLAQAVLELFPRTKLTIGPTTETGFFYDFQPEVNFKEEDLPRIEERMRELAKKNYKIHGGQVPKIEARKLYASNPFKLELIEGIPGETVGIYHQGDFYDLCRGGHVDAIGEIKHFMLTSISGSYWRADRSGTPLQRISGICFETQQELDDYLTKIEEAKLYDHRRLGKQLDLFTFHDEAVGMPFFHSKGTAVYNSLIAYSRQMQASDYEEIRTPLIMTEDLWKISGHYDNYKENMYFTEAENVSHCVRPMNCPSSMILYKERPHSYRELPLRLSEYGHVHRFELSGVLHGLFRVRAFTQDDAHIYCTEDQIEQEAIKCLRLAEKIYAKFCFTEIKMAISTRPEKSIGSPELWTKGINALKNALTTCGASFTIKEGEGAFYGPKIEIVVKDAMGREWQCGTVQVDFFLPKRFEIEYIDSDQSRKTPVVIHRAIYGSIERFLGIILEHFKGNLPLWLAPVQMRLLTITDDQKPYAFDVAAKLKAAGYRVEVDESGTQISAQIKRAQVEKLPWMLVIGKKEVETGTVTLRHRDGQQEFGLTVDALLEKAQQES